MKILAALVAVFLAIWAFSRALMPIVMGVVHVLTVALLAAVAIGILALVVALFSGWVQRGRRGSPPPPGAGPPSPPRVRPALAVLQDKGLAGTAARAVPLAPSAPGPRRRNRSGDSAPPTGATGSAAASGTSTPAPSPPHPLSPWERHPVYQRNNHVPSAAEIAETGSIPVRPWLRAGRPVYPSPPPSPEVPVQDGAYLLRRSLPAAADEWSAVSDELAARLQGRTAARDIRRVVLIERCSGIQYGQDNDQYSVYRVALPSAALKSSRDLARHMLSESRPWSTDAFTHDGRASFAGQAGGGATFRGLTETAAGDTLVIVRNSRGVQIGDGNTQHNEFRIRVTNVTVTAERYSLSQAAVSRLCQNPSRAAAEALADRVAQAAREHLVLDLTAEVSREVGDPVIPRDASAIYGRTGAQGGAHNRTHMKIAVDVVRVDADNLAADLLAEARRAAGAQRAVERERAAEAQRAAERERAAEAQRAAQILRAAEEQRAARERRAAEIRRAAEAGQRDIKPVRGPDIGPSRGPAAGGFGF